MGVGSTMAVVVLLALRVASAASLPSEVVGPPALEGDLCLTTSATAANGRKQFALRVGQRPGGLLMHLQT